jgi:hypothetical protein
LRGKKYSEREQCEACKQWLDLNPILCAELLLPPWDFPAYCHPDAKAPYPEGSPAAKSWKPDPDAVERFHMLQAASLAADQRDRASRT